MNESGNDFVPTGGSEMAELREEVASLRGLLSASLMLLFVFSLAVNIYLYTQASAVHAQASADRALINSFDNGGSAHALEFWDQLNNFGRYHPDFQPIIIKYSKFINVSRPTTPAPKK